MAVFTCSVCKTFCTSQEALQKHSKTKAHLDAAEAQRKAESSKPDSGKESPKKTAAYSLRSKGGKTKSNEEAADTASPKGKPASKKAANVGKDEGEVITSPKDKSINRPSPRQSVSPRGSDANIAQNKPEEKVETPKQKGKLVGKESDNASPARATRQTPKTTPKPALLQKEKKAGSDSSDTESAKARVRFNEPIIAKSEEAEVKENLSLVDQDIDELDEDATQSTYKTRGAKKKGGATPPANQAAVSGKGSNRKRTRSMDSELELDASENTSKAEGSSKKLKISSTKQDMDDTVNDDEAVDDVDVDDGEDNDSEMADMEEVLLAMMGTGEWEVRDELDDDVDGPEELEEMESKETAEMEDVEEIESTNSNENAEKNSLSKPSIADESQKAKEEKAVDVKKVEQGKNTPDAKQVEENKVAEMKKTAETKKAEETRKVAEAKKTEEAKKAEEARKIADEKRKAEESKKAEAAKKLADKKAEEAKKEAAKKAEEAKKEAAKKAEEAKKEAAKKAEEAKKEAAKKAEEAKKEAAKRAEEAKKETAKKAEEAKKEAAKKAEEAKKETAKKAEEAKKEAAKKEAAKKAEVAKKEAAKKAEEAKKEAAKKAEETKKLAAKKAEEAKKAEDAKKEATKKVEESKREAVKKAEDTKKASMKAEEARQESAKKAQETTKKEETRKEEDGKKAASAKVDAKKVVAAKAEEVKKTPTIRTEEVTKVVSIKAGGAKKTIEQKAEEVKKDGTKKMKVANKAETAAKSADSKEDDKELAEHSVNDGDDIEIESDLADADDFEDVEEIGEVDNLDDIEVAEDDKVTKHPDENKKDGQMEKVDDAKKVDTNEKSDRTVDRKQSGSVVAADTIEEIDKAKENSVDDGNKKSKAAAITQVEDKQECKDGTKAVRPVVRGKTVAGRGLHHASATDKVSVVLEKMPVPVKKVGAGKRAARGRGAKTAQSAVKEKRKATENSDQMDDTALEESISKALDDVANFFGSENIFGVDTAEGKSEKNDLDPSLNDLDMVSVGSLSDMDMSDVSENFIAETAMSTFADCDVISDTELHEVESPKPVIPSGIKIKEAIVSVEKLDLTSWAKEQKTLHLSSSAVIAAKISSDEGSFKKLTEKVSSDDESVIILTEKVSSDEESVNGDAAKVVGNKIPVTVTRFSQSQRGKKRKIDSRPGSVKPLQPKNSNTTVQKKTASSTDKLPVAKKSISKENESKTTKAEEDGKTPTSKPSDSGSSTQLLNYRIPKIGPTKPTSDTKRKGTSSSSPRSTGTKDSKPGDKRIHSDDRSKSEKTDKPSQEASRKHSPGDKKQPPSSGKSRDDKNRKDGDRNRVVSDSKTGDIQVTIRPKDPKGDDDKRRKTSPKRDSRSKRDKKVTPDRLYRRRSPPRRHRSPLRVHRSPLRVHRSPLRVSRSPLRVSRVSPGRRARGPLRRSPLRRSRSPLRRSRSPLRRSRSPLRRSRSPLYRGRSPLRRSRSPPHFNSSPLRQTRSPVKRSRSPRRKLSEDKTISYNTGSLDIQKEPHWNSYEGQGGWRSVETSHHPPVTVGYHTGAPSETPFTAKITDEYFGRPSFNPAAQTAAPGFGPFNSYLVPDGPPPGYNAMGSQLPNADLRMGNNTTVNQTTIPVLNTRVAVPQQGFQRGERLNVKKKGKQPPTTNVQAKGNINVKNIPSAPASASKFPGNMKEGNKTSSQPNQGKGNSSFNQWNTPSGQFASGQGSSSHLGASSFPDSSKSSDNPWFNPSQDDSLHKKYGFSSQGRHDEGLNQAASGMDDILNMIGSQAKELTQASIPMKDVLSRVVALQVLKRASGSDNSQIRALREQVFTELVKEEFGDTYAEKLKSASDSSFVSSRPSREAPSHGGVGSAPFQRREAFAPHRESFPAVDTLPKRDNLLDTLDSKQKVQIAQQLASVLAVTGQSEVSEDLLARLVQQAITSKSNMAGSPGVRRSDLASSTASRQDNPAQWSRPDRSANRSITDAGSSFSSWQQSSPAASSTNRYTENVSYGRRERGEPGAGSTVANTSIAGRGLAQDSSSGLQRSVSANQSTPSSQHMFSGGNYQQNSGGYSMNSSFSNRSQPAASSLSSMGATQYSARQDATRFSAHQDGSGYSVKPDIAKPPYYY